MEIEFWEEPNGFKPVWEFIKTSQRKNPLLKKLEFYESQSLNNLLRTGSAAELKGIKSKYGFSIYEFKPKPDRILFVVLNLTEKAFLIHAFLKKSDKTREKEINKALRIAAQFNKKYKLK